LKRPFTADRWRKLARDARTAAERMSHPTARRELTEIAAAYDRLAENAERMAGRRAPRLSD
jgi:hypothetical protein